MRYSRRPILFGKPAFCILDCFAVSERETWNRERHATSATESEAPTFGHLNDSHPGKSPVCDRGLRKTEKVSTQKYRSRCGTRGGNTPADFELRGIDDCMAA
jgi:hypothetical protein